MAYKPFKMKGHTLPGINQRSEGDTDLPDGRSGSSPFQHTAYGSPHPINPKGKEQRPGAGHPNTPQAHNVKAKEKSPAKWFQFIPMIASSIGGMNKGKEK